MMRTYELIREVEDAANHVVHTSAVLIQLPNGDFAHIKKVVVKNGEVVLIATMDARAA
jgi:hypothetical protein